MAASLKLIYLALFFLVFSIARARPPLLVLPVKKFPAARQYITYVYQGTPPMSTELVVDLSGSSLWLDCDAKYDSSTYRPARCLSAQCSLAKATRCRGCVGGPRPGCNSDACLLFPENPVTGTVGRGELAEDVIALHATDGFNPEYTVKFPGFLFACGSTSLLRGLAGGAKGIAGLGRSRIALPSQLSAEFRFNRKFALCLSSSETSNGVIFFGDGPYVLLPVEDISKSLTYTPLILNPASTTGDSKPSDEYFIGLKSIKINQKRIPLNSSLLLIDNNGVGGTKISTVTPYTALETSIYNSIVNEFVNSAAEMGIARVAPVPPFGACFSTKNVATTSTGPIVPTIDLVLQSELVYWRILGANSMIFAEKDVMCLAFVDAGWNPMTSIVVGGQQLEDNLLQFDLATSRLGFTQTTCASFKFTSNRSVTEISVL
ncbi:probable aspartic proteinase GIP2 [Aristolochia californica]|uniref:probable aspartic proteinase GIP2 n=1 Tax=Aristolochia californica TaxID=171875 RepID=UPI0035D6C043